MTGLIEYVEIIFPGHGAMGKADEFQGFIWRKVTRNELENEDFMYESIDIG